MQLIIPFPLSVCFVLLSYGTIKKEGLIVRGFRNVTFTTAFIILANAVIERPYIILNATL